MSEHCHGIQENALPTQIYNPEQRLFAKLGRQRHFTCKRITTAEHKITCKTSADQVIDRIRNMILIFKCAEHWKLWFAFWGMLNP